MLILIKLKKEIIIEFTIIELDWQKRRVPKEDKIKAISVEIPDFKKESSHMCDVIAKFNDGVTRTLKGRVTQNPVTKIWAVNGIMNGGFVVGARLVE